MKSRIFFIAAFIAAITSANAQSPELKKWVQKALTQAPRLLEQEQNQRLRSSRVDYMKTYLLPTASLSGSYTYIDPVAKAELPIGPGIVKTLTFQPNQNINLAVAANYIVLDFGRAKNAIDKALEEMSVSNKQQEAIKHQIAAQIANVYYGIQFGNEALRIQDSLILYLNENLAWTNARLRSGDAFKLDVLNLTNVLDQEKNRSIELKAQIEKQIAWMRYYTNTEINIPRDPDFSFPYKDGNFEESTQPDLAVAKSQIRLAQLDDEAAKKQFMPLIGVTAGMGIRNGYQPDINENRFNWLAGLNLNVPLFSGGRYWKQKNLGKLSLDLAKLGYDNIVRQVQKDQATAMADWMAINEKMKLAANQEKTAAEALTLAQSRYRNGISTQIDVLNALAQWHKTKLNTIQLTYQLALVKVELAKLNGNAWW
jgi:outer membrane protein TolC